MRLTAFMMILAGVSSAQNLTEFGSAATVGSVAGANGQNVSKGLTAIFGKINEQTVKAAGKGETRPPALELAAGQPKADASGVPLPPPPAGRYAGPSLPVAHLVVPREATVPFTLAESVPVLPPPPEMSAEKLKTVSTGMSRVDLLRMGAPAAKITMDEDGHTLEIYSYRQKDQKIGTVRLNNGTVASVE